jgi:cytoskeletal protein CcmA (bactofilin family)
MFGNTSKSTSQLSEAPAVGNVQVLETTPLGSDLEVASTKAPAQARLQPPARDYPILESIDGDGLVLIGKNTQLVGEISNCSRVEIQGALEGTVVAETVVVREGGMIKGHMRTTNADIQGIVEGEIVVDGLLDVKSTGQVTGDITYGQFSVQVGGVVAGQFSGRPAEQGADYEPVAEVATSPDPGSIPNGDGYGGPHTQ